jgi:hypothetical protein
MSSTFWCKSAWQERIFKLQQPENIGVHSSLTSLMELSSERISNSHCNSAVDKHNGLVLVARVAH